MLRPKGGHSVSPASDQCSRTAGLGRGHVAGPGLTLILNSIFF